MPLNRSGGMELDWWMAASILCKLSAISYMPAAFPPVSLEIASLSSFRVGGSLLMGGTSTRIVILLASRITVGVYLIQLLKILSPAFTNPII